ncbi:Probable RNA-directed DNA polymerase from transposon BS [Eumeta japonica]|uniref:Probable RNA-directed DNA polymerase from transposon BS n=1 Tax=Eumeta variegata TaxID=151549 RepID=A0A4C1SKA9_EUMVA|nr:Probable RNA-directed DNA polymerase from transposon BS [Eumeta japonica]
MGLDVISSGEPTYWPSDRQKIPDVIDFGVTKNISRELVDVEASLDFFRSLLLLYPFVSHKDTSYLSKYESSEKLHRLKNIWKILMQHRKPTILYGERLETLKASSVQAALRNSSGDWARSDCEKALFIDVSQAFDKVWHEGLILKLKLHLPTNIVKLLENYITSRKFVVKEGEFVSLPEYIASGVPQGSILGPLLYLIYTSDMPVGSNIHTSTFADDTACLSTHKIPQEAIRHLQEYIFSLNNG